MWYNIGMKTNVSIHAPTGGATETVKLTFALSPGFNSRAHGGRDVPNALI